MTFTRDPLSERYDAAAGEMIDRAIRRLRTSGWVPGVIASPADDPREATPLALSRHERAFQRALYHDGRIHHAARGRHPESRYSLKVDWGERIGRTRLLRIRLFTDTSAARKVRKDYGKGNSWIKNPELRSTAALSRYES